MNKLSKVLTKFDFEGVGVATKISATKINSEFAALIAECFLHKLLHNSHATRKRVIEQLLYAKRCKINSD